MRFVLYASILGVAACSSGSPAPAPVPTPRPVRPTTTSAAITTDDLRLRMEAFAHDSMLGREAGSLGGVRATDYLATELRRLGLDPAGDNGTYFQTIPLVTRRVDTSRVLRAGDVTLAFRRDWIPVPSLGFFPFGVAGSLDGAEVIFGGRLGAGLVEPEQAAGKLVVFLPPAPNGQPMFQFWLGTGNETLAQYSEARGVAIASLDISPPQLADILTDTQEDMATGSIHASSGPLGLVVTMAAARQLLGVDPTTARPGHTGPAVQGGPAYHEALVQHPARNVIAILPGADPARRHTYVALGAHSDHIGTVERPIEHDSLRAFNRVVRPGGVEDQERATNPQEQSRIRQTIDSLRLRRPPRADSVFNGADDDGSGSMALLEMAEFLVNQSPRPARSLLFTWHTAEEKGLFGAQYFTEHPTVPRDSIVAQLNMDMIGRGGRWDTDGGGPAYMQLIGSRRLSSELGTLVERVNTDGGFGFLFDYEYDADGHPQNFYCRSDHYMYARFSIPVVFFSTGGHVDYHMLTDEPQYIDYDKLMHVTRFISAVATQVAGLPSRPVVDGPRPDPYGVCQQ